MQTTEYDLNKTSKELSDIVKQAAKLNQEINKENKEYNKEKREKEEIKKINEIKQHTIYEGKKRAKAYVATEKRNTIAKKRENIPVVSQKVYSQVENRTCQSDDEKTPLIYKLKKLANLTILISSLFVWPGLIRCWITQGRVVWQDDKVIFGQLFSSVSYPIDRIYFHNNKKCQDVGDALAYYVDAKDISRIIDYNKIPERTVCLGEMVRIPPNLVKNETGLAKGVVDVNFASDGAKYFSGDYYVCNDISINSVAKLIAGDVGYAKIIVDYNKLHNHNFQLTKDYHCQGYIMIPKHICSKNYEHIRNYSDRKILYKERLKKPKIKINNKLKNKTKNRTKNKQKYVKKKQRHRKNRK